ncbi:MAG: hypothetical protein ACYDC8_03065 [Gammaproteobacteria bacterium]
MYKTINLHGKNVRVELTRTAQRAEGELAAPLVAEIHLIFGCMVVKRVWFKPITTAESVPILGNLFASFCTVRYAKHCRISHIDSGEEEPTEFPIVRDKKVFVPHWLRVDYEYKNNKWVGIYGYDRGIALETSRFMDALAHA